MGGINFSGIAALANEGGEIGAAPLKGYGQSVAIQGMQQEQQERALQMQMQQRQLKDQDALTKTMSQYNPATMGPGDVIRLMTQNGGSGQAALAAQQGLITAKQNLLKLSDTDLQRQMQLSDAMQGAHEAVTNAAAGDKQQVWTQQLGQLQKLGVDTSKEPAQYPGDEAMATHLIPLQFGTKMLEQEATRRKMQQEQSQSDLEKAQAEAANYKEDPNLGLIDLRTKQPVSTAGSAPLNAQEAEVLGKNEGDMVPLKLKNTANEIVNRGVRAVQAGGRSLLVDNQGHTIKDMGAATPVVVNNLANNTGAGGTPEQVAQKFGMTPIAFDQQAEKYFTTGQLPQVGRGGNGLALQRALMNRAAELHPDASLAGNEAAFRANQGSLNGLVKQRDAVSAFENTAVKNLDQFMTTAKGVIDSGSPLINKPLRAVAGSVLGTQNQAAFDAARQVALTEIAKVVNNPGLSGQLSDSGRSEVMALNPATATLGQIYRVAGILKQDMANRHQSYNEQIADIQKRIGTANTAEPSQQTTSQSGGNAGGATKTYKGHTYAQQSDGSWKLQQ